ncbi:ABC transporter ATP-binding protein [Embleya sp. AB8]|uniref:ABC transporter ATP-binding protein n=1 Tax=Embleya sp. AB8 TaxID=3156304 RepID=UPI003C75F72C
MSPFLEVRDLKVRFATEGGVVKAVDGVSFTLERGKTLGIVGESGSGKSVTNLTLLGLHNPARTTVTGSALLDGTELIGAPERTLRDLRGRRISMVFQDPLTALSPYYPVGAQIAETYRRHTRAGRKEAAVRAVEMLDRVGIPQPDRRAREHPHLFSGGMRQRAMIAMALVCEPDLLIADEPTTALDVTVQAQILELLAELQAQLGTAIILVTHDLGVVADVTDDVLVMYAGRAVERGSADEVLGAPRHPYTRGLLASVPRLSDDVDVPLQPVPGSPPSLLAPPPGCAFHPRCAQVIEGSESPCRTLLPVLTPATTAQGHAAACHLQSADSTVWPIDQEEQGATA